MGEFTYEHLFDVLRRERGREELQELDSGFYGTAQAYIDDTATNAREADVMSSEGDKLRTQLQNAKKLLKELYDRREKKIMLLALNKARTQSSIIDTSPLLDEEKQLYERVVDALANSRDTIAPLINGISKAPAPKPPKLRPQPQETPKEESGTAKVRMRSAVPKFLGANKESFGPFEEGQEVRLPENIARILVKKGRAEQA